MAFLGPSLRRARVPERPAARLGVALLVSLLANVVILVAAWRMGAFDLAKPVKEQRVVLAPLTADQWSHNRAITGQPLSPAARPMPAPPLAVAPPPPPPPPPPKPPEPDARQPIVDVAPSQDSRPPKDGRFLSDRDNTVEKETRSRFAGTRSFQNRAAAPVQGEDRKAEQARAAGEGGTAREMREEKRGTAAPRGTGAERATPPTPERRELAMLEPKRSDGLTPEPAPRTPPPGPPGPAATPGTPGAPAEGQRKMGDARLLPSANSMAKVLAGPSANDLSDANLEEGDATLLNTRYFKYAAFYNRVWQSIYEQWRPDDAYTARDPRYTTFPIRNRATTFTMRLSPAGEIKDLKVLRSCGLDFLDRELVRAIRAAAPFENVPADLAAKGDVQIPPQTYAYILEGGGLQLRFVPPDADRR